MRKSKFLGIISIIFGIYTIFTAIFNLFNINPISRVILLLLCFPSCTVDIVFGVIGITCAIGIVIIIEGVWIKNSALTTEQKLSIKVGRRKRNSYFLTTTGGLLSICFCIIIYVDSIRIGYSVVLPYLYIGLGVGGGIIIFGMLVQLLKIRIGSFICLIGCLFIPIFFIINIYDNFDTWIPAVIVVLTPTLLGSISGILLKID